MLSGFDNGNTDRTCFDWDDGNGAFSFNSSENQAPRKRNEDSDEEDNEAN
jgi:hypothetical protein